jgi:predicted ATPase
LCFGLSRSKNLLANFLSNLLLNTKTVLASGLLRDEGDHYELGGPLPPLAIPSTLHDSLMARLDRLATVKEVAQVAAVIGRQFAYDLLAAVISLGDDELRDALDRLAGAGLVFRREERADATYTFKHGLVRDAAYQSLLKGCRQQLHARIAAVLEERFPETADAEPELLAQHCAEGGLAEREPSVSSMTTSSTVVEPSGRVVVTV